MTAVIHTRTFREVEITRRASDGFFNATQMCRVHSNRPAAYLTSQRGSEYLAALAENLGVLKDDLVSTQNGGVQPGTWVHPRVAVDMSRWLCPKFGVWMDGWFLEELSKSTRDDPESLTPATAGRGAVHQMQLMNETDLHYRVVALATGSILSRTSVISSTSTSVKTPWTFEGAQSARGEAITTPKRRQLLVPAKETL